MWPALAQVKPNNKHRELYLTDAVAILAAKGEKVLAQVAADAREVLGCNTRADLAEVDRIFREWKRAELMDAGVTIQLPETVLIDPDVIAGEDTVVEPTRSAAGQNQNRRSLHHSHRQRPQRHDSWRRCRSRAALHGRLKADSTIAWSSDPSHACAAALI